MEVCIITHDVHNIPQHYKMCLTFDDCSSDSRDVGELRGKAVEDFRQSRHGGPRKPLAEAVPGNGRALPSFNFRE